MVKSQAVLLTAILAAHIQKSRPCMEKSDRMRCQHHISSCPTKKIGWCQCCHLKLLLHTHDSTFSVKHPCRSFPLCTGQMHLPYLFVAFFFQGKCWHSSSGCGSVQTAKTQKWGMCVFQNTPTHREISFLTDSTDLKSALCCCSRRQHMTSSVTVIAIPDDNSRIVICPSTARCQQEPI